MEHRDWLNRILRCPACGNSLPWRGSHAACEGCGRRFPVRQGHLDLVSDDRLTPTQAGEAEGWPLYAQASGMLSQPAEVLRRYPHGPATGPLETYLRSEAAAKRLTRLNGGPSTLQEAIERGLLEEVLRAAGRGKPAGPAAVLDLGCGFGWSLRDFSLVGSRAVGVDVSAGMLSHAAEHLAAWGLDAPLVRACAERLPFAEGSFDLVYCTSLLHHLENMDTVLAEIRRLLRPSGRLAAIFERFEPEGADVDDHVASAAPGPYGIREGFVAAARLAAACERAGLRPALRTSWPPARAKNPSPSSSWLNVARLARRSGYMDLHASPSGRGRATREAAAAGLGVLALAARTRRALSPPRLPGRAVGGGPGLLDGWFELEGDFRWTGPRARVRVQGRASPSLLHLHLTAALAQSLEVFFEDRLVARAPLVPGHQRLALPLRLAEGPCVLSFAVSPEVPPALRPLDHRALGVAVRALRLA